MRALYTKTLIDFLQEHEESTEWQSVKTLFDAFFNVQLEIEETSEHITTMTFNMYDMFKDEYGYREIGSEDDQYFYYNIKKKLDELLIEYNPKIKAFYHDFTDLLNPLVELEETITDDGTTISQVFLNPVNTSTTKLRDKASNDIDSTRTRSYQQQMTYNDTKTKIMNEFLDLKNIYLECVAQFNDLFMLVY